MRWRRPRRARRRRAPTLGRLNVSWRWEVAAPLFLMGALIAVFTIRVRGAEPIFWIGVALAALAAGIFFSAPRGH